LKRARDRIRGGRGRETGGKSREGKHRNSSSVARSASVEGKRASTRAKACATVLPKNLYRSCSLGFREPEEEWGKEDAEPKKKITSADFDLQRKTIKKDIRTETTRPSERGGRNLSKITEGVGGRIGLARQPGVLQTRLKKGWRG